MNTEDKALDEAAEEGLSDRSSKLYAWNGEAYKLGFKDGANFERERAEKLVATLEQMIQEDNGGEFSWQELAAKALAEWRGDGK